jgi:hypothetical protein
MAGIAYPAIGCAASPQQGVLRGVNRIETFGQDAASGTNQAALFQQKNPPNKSGLVSSR